MINASGFAEHGVSGTTTHLCLRSMKAASDKMSTNGFGCVLTKRYLQEQVPGQLRPVGFQPLAQPVDPRIRPGSTIY